MRAEVTQSFKGRADGHPDERFFAPGEIIYGALAKQAVADGNADEAPVKARKSRKKK